MIKSNTNILQKKKCLPVKDAWKQEGHICWHEIMPENTILTRLQLHPSKQKDKLETMFISPWYAFIHD